MDCDAVINSSESMILFNYTKNSIPLSHYTTTLVYYPATHPMEESTMDIFVPQNDEKVNRNNNDPAWYDDPDPLWFYMNPTFSHPGLNINYIPLSSTSTTVSNSSQSKVSFGSSSSRSKVSSRSYIPDEVVFSILTKLSIKSMKRFGCVCKSWSILFENADFITVYNKHFISRHGSDNDYHTFIFTNNGTYEYDNRTYHYRPEFHLIENRLKLNLPSSSVKFSQTTCILGNTNVNGIFCFFLPQYTQFDQHVQYVLWNPLTQEFMVIPSSPAQLTQKFPITNIRHGVRHIFNGFGYDQLRDDFKIIQYISFSSSERHSKRLCRTSKCVIETYSVKSKSWTMIDMEEVLNDWGYFHNMPFDGHEVYADGACHWLVLDLNNNQHTMILLSFDLSDEMFLTTPIREESYYSHTCDPCLTVLNRSIALISNSHDDIVFDIFILGELGVSESWIKLYSCGPLPSIKWPPIGFGTMGYFFVTNKDNKVAYVDLGTQIIEEVGITGAHCTGFIVGLYMESKPSFDRRIK